MSPGVRPMSEFLAALFGPIVWSLHFFGLYLLQALLCTTTGAATAHVRVTGAGLTIAALLTLLAFAVRRYRASRAIAGDNGSRSLAFAGPLTALSILAILWTSVPLFLLPGCGTLVAGNDGANECAPHSAALQPQELLKELLKELLRVAY